MKEEGKIVAVVGLILAIISGFLTFLRMLGYDIFLGAVLLILAVPGLACSLLGVVEGQMALGLTGSLISGTVILILYQTAPFF